MLTVAWLPLLQVEAVSGNDLRAAARRTSEEGRSSARLLALPTVMVTHACPAPHVPLVNVP